MDMQMSFKQMDPSESLRVFTAEKCERLKKYFNGKITLHWTFEVKKLLKSAHCHMVGNHMDYFGQAETEDFKASIDEVIEKIETQLRRHKEIVKDHHKTG